MNSQDGSTPGMPADPSHQAGGPRIRSARRLPSTFVQLVVLALIICAVVVRSTTVIGDPALANILTFVCGVILLSVLGCWFLFFSGFARRTKVVSCVLGGTVLVLLIGLLRVEGFSGEMVPQFRPRWTKPPDQMLSRPMAAGPDSLELIESTEFDFPQFLGPRRDARVDNVELATDWQAAPPRLVWRQSIGAGWSTFAVAGGRAVTMEQRGNEEFVTCYAVDSGKLLWAYATPTRHYNVLGGVGPRSTPTISQGRVFTLGATGELLCLQLATGERVWRDNLLARYGVKPEEDEKAIQWGRAGSPLIVDHQVVVPAGGPAQRRKVTLAAFDAASGELAWEGGTDQIGYASPVLATLAGVRQILSVNESNVTGHDPETGRVLWQFSWPGNSTQNANCSQPVPVGEDHLFLSKGYGWGAALLRLATSPAGVLSVEQVWHERTLLKTKFTNVVVYQDHVYGLSDGILECAELATGRSRWKKGRYAQGQILGVGDVLLIQAEDGAVAMVDATPNGYRERGRFQALQGKTWNNLCLTGNRLLVRNSEEAACFDLPPF